MPARMRPRFEYVAPCPSGAAADRLRMALDCEGARYRGRVFGTHAVLHVPTDEDRIWSPFLSLDLRGHGEGTLVRGLYGPKPSVWTLFMAAYAICGFAAVFALGFLYAQWSLDQPMWAAGIFPLAALGALATYGTARYGQHRGREQMDALRTFLDDALGTA
ncbi:MAG TPA: hypothetical protein EYG39_01395 [Rhodothermales bacterium]|nr:hypothetical protein [Rhodothermales bacterium]